MENRRFRIFARTLVCRWTIKDGRDENADIADWVAWVFASGADMAGIGWRIAGDEYGISCSVRAPSLALPLEEVDEFPE